MSNVLSKILGFFTGEGGSCPRRMDEWAEVQPVYDSASV